MGSYLNLLRDISNQVRIKAQHLSGTSEAGKTIGKGEGGDNTKYIDKVTEEVVFNILKNRRISCTVISEEQGVTEILGGNSEIIFIVDSLDGTNNALRDIPFFAFSIAIADGPKLSHVHTALVSNLKLGDIFTAEKDRGAQLNGHPITPSKISRIEQSLIVINLSPSKYIAEKMITLVKRVRHTRHFGSASLEICYVASGKLDAYIDLRERLRVTDLAASYLILKEAGGFIVDEKGGNLDSLADSPKRQISLIASGNKRLLKKIGDVIL